MATVKKTPCKYGSKCYRKNPKHLEEFSHGEADRDNEVIEEKELVKKAEKKKTIQKDVTEPPAKKARTITDFFRNNDKKEAAKTNDSKKKAESEDEGNTSGYVRKEETEEEQHEKEASDDNTDFGPISPADIRENIKSKYDMEMPEDFYQLWDYAKTINNTHPQDAFKKSLGLQLVGPYDILASRKCKKDKKPNYHLHWRYYYDPPEFMTVIRGDDKSQFHIGYFRDDPNELPVFVASNEAKINGTISPRGENIFAALSWFIDDYCKKDKSKKDSLKKVQKDLEAWASKQGLSLDQKTKNMKARDKKVNCKTFHGAGMVVPVDGNEIGYREVPETAADLKKMFKKIVDAEEGTARDSAFDPLMELLMLVQFANDECDYGMGLELGLDLFTYGGDCFHPNILNLMPLAYSLLGRHVYKDIIVAHLNDRKHSANLSQLE